LEYEVRTMDA